MFTEIIFIFKSNSLIKNNIGLRITSAKRFYVISSAKYWGSKCTMLQPNYWGVNGPITAPPCSEGRPSSSAIYMYGWLGTIYSDRQQASVCVELHNRLAFKHYKMPGNCVIIDIFIARRHTDARYWYSKSACLSVRNVPVSDENGLTCRIVFFTIR